MALGKKTGGRNIQKGQVLNPRGAGAHNKELMTVRNLTQAQVAEVGSLVLNSNMAGLQAVAKDTEASALKVWFASVAVKGISKGDAGALNVILDRLVGKVKTNIDVSGSLDSTGSQAALINNQQLIKIAIEQKSKEED